jgi:hypothetical protein
MYVLFLQYKAKNGVVVYKSALVNYSMSRSSNHVTIHSSFSTHYFEKTRSCGVVPMTPSPIARSSI